ncbi:hypothetical protein GMSM_04700 [Geomonas sp. Red276]
MESWLTPLSASLLYVEDDPLSRELVCTALARKWPHLQLVTAENGEEGLRLYQDQHFDLVLTDICMPIMDGIKMAEKILGLDPDAKIVAATAISDTHFMLDAIQAGVSRYVLKPFDFKLLFATIGEILSQVTLGRRLERQTGLIRQLSHAVEQGPGMVIISDASGNIQYVNSRFSAVTGFLPGDVIGQNMRARLAGEAGSEYADTVWGEITQGKEWRGELVNLKKGGERYYEEVIVSPLTTTEGAICNFVAVMEDISERKRAEEKIRSLIEELEHRVRSSHGGPKIPLA